MGSQLPRNAIGRRPRYAPEAFRQSRRYANAKRGPKASASALVRWLEEPAKGDRILSIGSAIFFLPYFLCQIGCR
ncbi:MAG: hypothetical protein F6K65_12365 [Moorea sp. SIO3C2]|nr:hypothetical protein [Moorena sp. SIO3C2]